jgi:hypothetical protein
VRCLGLSLRIAVPRLVLSGDVLACGDGSDG